VTLQANDAYLEMAIGNAAWPIGVTMVGIHARTGREKIFARNVAHVLNDETQRKYIQVCVSYFQKCSYWVCSCIDHMSDCCSTEQQLQQRLFWKLLCLDSLTLMVESQENTVSCELFGY